MGRHVPARRMLTASVGDAVLALVIVLVVQQAAPVWTGFGVALGIVVGAAGYLAIRFRGFLTDRAVWRRALSRRMLLSRDLALSACGRMEFAAFAWSATLVSPAVTAILFATWPMMFVLFLERAVRAETGERRYRRINLETIMYFAVAFLGLVFVVAAQSSGSAPGGDAWSDTAAGIGLAVVSAFLAACNAFVYPWGMRLRDRIETEPNARRTGAGLSRDDLEIASTMLGTMISTIFAVPALFALSVAESRSGLSLGALAVMVLAGATLVTYLLVLQRRANLDTDNLGVNAIAYSTPVFALVLFWAFGQVGEVRTDFVVMGAAAIVAMNLFLSFDPEFRLGFNRRISFKALVIGFWAVGCVVVMREKWLPDSEVDLEPGAYWALVALIGTIFTLLISFRVSRVQARISFEEHHTALLFRKVERLVTAGVLHRLAIRALADIDVADRADRLAKPYATLRRCFRRAHRGLAEDSSAMSSEVSAVEGDADSLVQSKQLGKEFAELVSVVLLAALAVSLLVVVRPELDDWAGFANDMATVVVAAVLIFLVLNLFDLQRERRTPFLAEHPRIASEYGVLLRLQRSPIIEQAMSAGIGFGIVVAFTVLLAVRQL